MATKSLKKVTKQPAPKAGAKRSDRTHSAQPHGLDSQRQRPKKAAAVGAKAVKSFSRAAMSAPAVSWPTPAPT